MGTVVEVLSDDKGIIWPEEISPFQVHLVSLGNDENVIKLADEIYKTFQKEGIEVLYDDRDVRAGEKFADSDLIGISTRLVIGDKALESKKLEVKDRSSGQTTETDLKSFIKKFKK